MFYLHSILIFLLSVFSGYEGMIRNPATKNFEFRIVTQTEEIAMGTQEFKYLQSAMGGPDRHHPELQKYLEKVGKKIASASDRPDLPYEFLLVNNPMPNASCLPGGKVIVHLGLFKVVKDESELAAVLAHEIAHANLRHGAKKREKEILADLMMHPAERVAYQYTLNFTPENEFEADYYGLKYLSAAGYDPQAALDSQLRMETFFGGSDPHHHPQTMLKTHPDSKERQAALKKAIKEYPKGGIRGKEIYKQLTSNI